MDPTLFNSNPDPWTTNVGATIPGSAPLPPVRPTNLGMTPPPISGAIPLPPVRPPDLGSNQYPQNMDMNQVGPAMNSMQNMQSGSGLGNYLSPQQRNGMMTYAQSLLNNQPPATSWGSGLNEMLRSYMANSPMFNNPNNSYTTSSGQPIQLINSGSQPMQLPSAGGGGGFNPMAIFSGLFGGGSSPPTST